MTLPRLDTLNLKIPVIYSSTRRAWAIGDSSDTGGDAGGGNLYAPPQQGNNFLPIVFFKYTNATQDYSRTIPYEHILKQREADGTYKLNKPMLVYELTYTASMYCGIMQDADLLIFKFMSEFRPQCNLWIGDEGDKNTDGTMDRTKGLYAHMVLESVTDATEYEPGDIGERVVRKDMSWKITEAYVPTIPYKVDDKIIKDVYFNINGGQ
jgi:hypothetical protein